MSPEVPFIILILSIPIYFLAKWLLKKLNCGNNKNRKFLAIVPTLVLGPLVYTGMIVIWILFASYYPNNDFNKHEWESNPEERYEMSKDIIKSNMLIGKTKMELTEILGEDYYEEYDGSFLYELGVVPGMFKIDPDFLKITFSDGLVVSVSQFEG